MRVSSTTRLLTQQMDELNRLVAFKDYVRRNGIDVEGNDMYNSKGDLNVYIPAIESLPYSGRVTDHVSISAMEGITKGITNITSKLVATIVKMIGASANAMRTTWSKVHTVFGEYEGRIKDLRRRMANRTDIDSTELKDKTISVPSNLDNMHKSLIPIWESVMTWIDIDELSDAEYMNREKAGTAYAEKLEGIALGDAQDTPIDPPRVKADSFLTKATNVVESIKKFSRDKDNFLRRGKMLQDKLLSFQKAETHTDQKVVADKIKRMGNGVKIVSKSVSLLGKILKKMHTVVKTYIKLAVACIKQGTTKPAKIF